MPTAYPRSGLFGSKATPIRLPTTSTAAGSGSQLPVSPRHIHICPPSPTAYARVGVGQATARRRGVSTRPPGLKRLSGIQPLPGS